MWTPICAAWNWVLAGWPKEYAPPLIALGGFALAFVTYRSSKKRDSFRLGIDLILRLGERFDSETMRARRANAAKALLSHPTKQDAAVNDVLDFFEEVAFLVKRRAIDLEAVDQFFGYWLETYARATVEYRQERNSPLTWDALPELCALVEQLEDWESSRDNHAAFRPRRVHAIAWHLWRKRRPEYHWTDFNAEAREKLREECALIPRARAVRQRPRSRRARERPSRVTG